MFANGVSASTLKSKRHSDMEEVDLPIDTAIVTLAQEEEKEEEEEERDLDSEPRNLDDLPGEIKKILWSLLDVTSLWRYDYF
jgi:hypothetical protein